MVRTRHKGKTLVQTGLRLEAEILDRLRGGKLGLSDEIRDRLERTFQEDAIDPVTRELCAMVVDLGRQLWVDYERQWHQSHRAYRAFRAGLKDLLDQFEPVAAPDEPAPLGNPQPQTIGWLRAQDIRRSGLYPHMDAASKRRPTSQPFQEEELKGMKS